MHCKTRRPTQRNHYETIVIPWPAIPHLLTRWPFSLSRAAVRSTTSAAPKQPRQPRANAATLGLSLHSGSPEPTGPQGASIRACFISFHLSCTPCQPTVSHLVLLWRLRRGSRSHRGPPRIGREQTSHATPRRGRVSARHGTSPGPDRPQTQASLGTHWLRTTAADRHAEELNATERTHSDSSLRHTPVGASSFAHTPGDTLLSAPLSLGWARYRLWGPRCCTCREREL